MSVYHHSSKHFPGQAPRAPEPGIVALFTASVAAHVAQQRRAGADSDTQLHVNNTCYPVSDKLAPLVTTRTAAGHEADSAEVYPKARTDHTPDGGKMVGGLHNPDTSIRCDVELARICVGLRRSAELRVWLLITEHTRETGFNYISRADLMALLERYGIQYTRHNLNRWLRQGQGTFWRLTTYGRVYLISYERLSIALTLEAATHDLPDLHDLVETNIPGMRNAMYLNVTSNTVTQFEAQVFAAWHASRNNPQISRYALTRLFNRDVKTMIAWQRSAGIYVLHSIVHYTEEFSHDVPHAPEGGLRGGVLEYKVNGRKRWSAEYSNSYQTQPIKQHHKRGASRRVFAIIRDKLLSLEPASFMRQGVSVKRRRPGGLHRTGKYLYQDAKRARSSAKRYGDDKQRAFFKGVDGRRCVHFEHSPDGRERTRFRACTQVSLTLEGRKTHKCMEIMYRPF